MAAKIFCSDILLSVKLFTKFYHLLDEFLKLRIIKFNYIAQPPPVKSAPIGVMVAVSPDSAVIATATKPLLFIKTSALLVVMD
jgi:hypothetical protein